MILRKVAELMATIMRQTKGFGRERTGVEPSWQNDFPNLVLVPA